MPVITGLSGNEMFCLNRKGLRAGDLVVGNSVFSMGVLGGLGSGVRTFLGGEVEQVTSVVHEGRQMSYERLKMEAERRGGVGITGVTSELVMLGTNIEFVSVGSTLHSETGRAAAGGAQPSASNPGIDFSTAADGQELFCQLDCGFQPVKFCFANCAYSVGAGGALAGGLKSLSRGEVPHFSEVFNHTRHRTLERIANEARNAGANAVVGIRTSIVPFRGMQEMLMIGTAASHPALPPQFAQRPITSDLTCQEMWNLARVGYVPLQLVLGVSVYSIGLAGRLSAWLKSWSRGEIPELTHLIYEARENAIDRIKRDAEACGADDVAGIKTYVYELGNGMIELMAIGTAVKRMEGIRTFTDQLPVQAIMRDKDTFINAAEGSLATSSDAQPKSGNSGFDLLKIIIDIFFK